MTIIVIVLIAAVVIRLIVGGPITHEGRVLVLRALSAGEITSGEVMKATGLSPGNGYAILYGMEHRGLVSSRKVGPGRWLYGLTEKGQAALQDALK